MTRVRIGVVGCGAVAQIQHLPFISELAEEFKLVAVCDVSPSAAKYAAELFHVPNSYTDYRDLLASDVDAVLLCQTDPKTEVATATLDAGKHMFIEKPVCLSLDDVDEIIAAAEKASVVAQAGYVKLYEPAFEAAVPEVRDMEDVHFVQINHLHPDNSLHIGQFRTRQFSDVQAALGEQLAEARSASIRSAIGDVPPHVERAYMTLSGSLIHDLYGLRLLFGLPSSVLHTDIWNDGRAVSTTLEYPSGFRCVASWVDLPRLWDFYETLEVYGSDKRVIVQYATGFSRGVSTLTVHEIDDTGTTVRRQPTMDWESPFRRELRHFHECVADGVECRSPVSDARDDISLIIDIAKAYIGGGRVDRG